MNRAIEKTVQANDLVQKIPSSIKIKVEATSTILGIFIFTPQDLGALRNLRRVQLILHIKH